MAAPTMMSLEVAADAAEPPKVVAFTAVFPKAMVPTAVSPELAVHAVEPSEVVVFASAPCMVVAPNTALSARHVTVEGTVTELSLHPVGTTVEPPEVAASAVDPLGVSVVPIYELSSCPVMAKEADCEFSSCPVLSQLTRPSVNSLLVLSQPEGLSLNSRPVLSWLRRLFMNCLVVLSRP